MRRCQKVSFLLGRLSRGDIVAQALVTTELRGPRTRPNLVLRPRLREALDRDEGCRLTIVSASAGFGKTTLLVE